MPSQHSRVSVVLGLAMPLLLGAFPAGALAQSPVTFNQPTNCAVRVSLVGRDGNFLTVPCTVSVLLGEPPASGSGAMSVRAFHVALVNCTALVPLTGGNVPISITQLVCDAAPSGATIAAVSDGAGGSTFAGTGISTSATGTVNYTAVNLACRDMTLGNAPCSGPFNLATPGANTSARIDNGIIAAASGGTRDVSFEFRASFPLVTGATWGRVDLLGRLAGTIPSGAPVCRPDFNGSDGLNVQDIFDFLAAWFAGSAQADFNHTDGLGVQDIFDFLAAWFAGC